eukprot:CAMPEP_0172458600 /NCGR_PEP_ID=MMETSP1065-20121228/28356_1 /TAXON_ID=265537 /ORGANISM="Amphiprora paludosa, Strain CCMP125" /LENGTH=537 /DNA_ID=CAMNT_0013212939 /DNA_START=110 /DNA_END=1723 /DNA_ORIENTATION=-
MNATTTSMSLTSSRRSGSSVLPVTSPKLKMLTPEQGSRAKLRKLPDKTSSFNIPSSTRPLRASPGASDSAPILPDRAPESTLTSPAPTKRPARARSSVFRAAEGGKGDVLPLLNSTNESKKPPLRSRARSSNSTLSRSSFGGFGRVTSDQLQSSAKSLRARKRSSSRNDTVSSVMSLNDSGSFEDQSVDGLPLYEVDEKFSKSPIYADDSMMNADELSLGANKKHSRPFPAFLSTSGPCPQKYDRGNLWLNMKKPQFVMLMLLLGITCFVAGSYQQVLQASDVIEEVKMGESKLLVHMHKVEQQALQFAENLKRLNDRNEGGNIPIQNEDGSSAAQVDSDLIRVQIEKLRDMENELDHEVRALRKKIQVSSKQSLIDTYGEGAIQVFLDVYAEDENGVSDGKRHTISIRLWYDTPHSAWTFLQQIQKGVWSGATFSLQQGRALVAEPSEGGPLQPSLDFVESSDRGHERYTITLTDTAMAINLQDNRKYHRQEACVGVIFEGFDVLHSIVKDSATKTVKIQKATATHMTRAESAGLI